MIPRGASESSSRRYLERLEKKCPYYKREPHGQDERFYVLPQLGLGELRKVVVGRAFELVRLPPYIFGVSPGERRFEGLYPAITTAAASGLIFDLFLFSNALVCERDCFALFLILVSRDHRPSIIEV